MDGTPLAIDILPDPKGGFACRWQGTAEAQHEFVVGFTNESKPDSVLSIDSMWYHPSYESVRPDGAYVVYNHDDVEISRTGNWTTLEHGGSNATLTEDKGASLTMPFTGPFRPFQL